MGDLLIKNVVFWTHVVENNSHEFKPIEKHVENEKAPVRTVFDH